MTEEAAIAYTIRLSPRRERAAQLLADGRLTQKEVSERVSAHQVTITRWLKDPAFIARVEQLRANQRQQADEILYYSVPAAATFLAEVATGKHVSAEPKTLSTRVKVALWLVKEGRQVRLMPSVALPGSAEEGAEQLSEAEAAELLSR